MYGSRIYRKPALRLEILAILGYLGWVLSGEASYILYSLAGESMNSMTLTHDWEWNEYPYIARALRQLGAAELPYALASRPFEALTWW